MNEEEVSADELQGLPNIVPVAFTDGAYYNFPESQRICEGITFIKAKGVADPATIDLTWRCATGAPAGPFQILDVVGLTTAYNIVIMNPEVKNPDSLQAKIAAMLKEYIDAGKTGVNAGEGFYKYQ